MKKPWLDWSTRRFLVTVLPAAMALIAARRALAVLTESPVWSVVGHFAFLLGVFASLYVTFTWAAERDRRDPAWKRSKRTGSGGNGIGPHEPS